MALAVDFYYSRQQWAVESLLAECKVICDMVPPIHQGWHLASGTETTFQMDMRELDWLCQMLPPPVSLARRDLVSLNMTVWMYNTCTFTYLEAWPWVKVSRNSVKNSTVYLLPQSSTLSQAWFREVIQSTHLIPRAINIKQWESLTKSLNWLGVFVLSQRT